SWPGGSNRATPLVAQRRSCWSRQRSGNPHVGCAPHSVLNSPRLLPRRGASQRLPPSSPPKSPTLHGLPTARRRPRAASLTLVTASRFHSSPTRPPAPTITPFHGLPRCSSPWSSAQSPCST